MDSYKTIEAPAQAEMSEQRSRFLGYIFPAATKEEAQNHINGLKKLHPQATHCCWAYRVGAPDSPESYYSDDGEPSGTAGQPILATLQQRELQNAVIGVIRYYGGIKLGVRGLIDAYKLASQLAAEKAAVIEKKALESFPFQCPYAAYDSLRYKIEKLEGKIENPVFTSKIEGTITVPRPQAKAARDIAETLARS